MPRILERIKKALLGMMLGLRDSWEERVVKMPGVNHALPNAPVRFEILREKLSYIKAANADIIAVACASCFEQFELGQVMIKKKHKEKYGLPTLYIAQLIGLAMGMDPEILGLHEHIYKMKKLLPLMEERLPPAQVSVPQAKVHP